MNSMNCDQLNVTRYVFYNIRAYKSSSLKKMKVE